MNDLIEVKLKVDKKIVIETLQRIGIANKKEKILYPSCYLYEKDNKFFIVHFKELFSLTREKSYNNFSENDAHRRNSIIFCLKEWGLITVNEKEIEPHSIYVYVLSHKDKPEWKINHKININDNTEKGNEI